MYAPSYGVVTLNAERPLTQFENTTVASCPLGAVTLSRTWGAHVGFPKVSVVVASVIFEAMTKLDGHVNLMDASGRMLGGKVGVAIGTVGVAVGVGDAVGLGVVLGVAEGLAEGDAEGVGVAATVGDALGVAEGLGDGDVLGLGDGLAAGSRHALAQ